MSAFLRSGAHPDYFFALSKAASAGHVRLIRLLAAKSVATLSALA
jgi:hypothetical protein